MIDVFTTSLFFIATITFVLGLFCIKKVFILLAKNTLNLLNTLIDKRITEDEKQTQLIRLTKGVLGPLLISCIQVINLNPSPTQTCLS